jgi:two-component system response regulator WspF
VALVGAALDDAADLTRTLSEELGCPVMVIAEDSAAARSATFELMSAGAVDVLVLPGLSGGVGDVAGLRAKLAILRRLSGRELPVRRSSTTINSSRPVLVALGASTGGPHALASVLTAFPATLAATVLIVQHIDPQFSEGMAQWLSRTTGFPVELATPGARPRPGTAYVGAVGQHMVVEPDGSLGFTNRPRDAAHRPSIDVLFTSLVRRARPGIAALLTGMGRDGAAGLAALRTAGWRTIAQDEATCVVYGMPKAAVEMRAAIHVLPLDQIGPAITRMVGELNS